MPKYHDLAFNEDTPDQRRKKRGTTPKGDFEDLLEVELEEVVEAEIEAEDHRQPRKLRGKDWDEVAYSRRRKLHRRERRVEEDY